MPFSTSAPAEGSAVSQGLTAKIRHQPNEFGSDAGLWLGQITLFSFSWAVKRCTSRTGSPLTSLLVHYWTVNHPPFRLAGRQADPPLNKQICFPASCVSWDKNKDVGNLLNDIQPGKVGQVRQLGVMKMDGAEALGFQRRDQDVMDLT